MHIVRLFAIDAFALVDQYLALRFEARLMLVCLVVHTTDLRFAGYVSYAAHQRMTCHLPIACNCICIERVVIVLCFVVVVFLLSSARN